MRSTLPVILLAVAATAASGESRQLDAHEHGVGALNIAVDGNLVAMELMAPGADIVGFEYRASSAGDLAAVEAALAVLAQPLDLFDLSEAAGCIVTEAHAELEGDDHDAHDEHGDEHQEHGDDHADDHGNDHKEHGDDHADDHGDTHDDHDEAEGHDDHEAEGHDDHDDGDHEGGHTEFHAEYLLTCDAPDALTEIRFDYFDAFENAREVEVQVLGGEGATAYEVSRDAPVLDLRGAF